MFDIGWSELVVIAVVALIAIGPKELPGVLRMVGQWMGKARKMASEFQGQFQEAMREAEMADLKKSFDEVKEAATGLTSGNIMTSLQKDVGDALRIDDIDKPLTDKPATDKPAIENPVDAQIASAIGEPVTPTGEPVTPTGEPVTPAAPTSETFVEAEAHAAASEPLAITREVLPAPQDITPAAPQDISPAAADVLKDAKAS
jgi:sec-independent protein translocase protein TatB